MAENNRYRDVYTLVSVFSSECHLFKNDRVIFYNNDAYDSNDKLIGPISCYVDDVLSISPTLEQFRIDGISPVNAENYAFANSHDLDGLGLESGIVVGIVGELAIVYCGCMDLPKQYGLIDAQQYYDEFNAVEDEERYAITEKGLKYLADIENIMAKTAEDIVNEVCSCVCPEEREENSTMDNLFGNLGFGKLKGDRFKLSMNGIAVAQPNGKYVVYNQDNNEFVDATNTLFDFKDALFLLPAVEVNAGDTVIHEGKAYFIVDTTNEIKAVSYDDCTQTVLIPKSTMFGIKYFTKVFSMFGDNFAAAGDLFSNPMMLMALMEGKNSDLTQLMLFSSLSNGDLGSNPMALAMMLKGDKGDDSLSTIAMLSMFNNGTNPFAPKKKEAKKNIANN